MGQWDDGSGHGRGSRQERFSFRNPPIKEFFLRHMNVTRISVLAVALCCLQMAGYAQKLIVAQKEILMLQDQRSLGNGKLVSYLQHRDRDLRYRAAIALANIQDTTTIDVLLPLLLDEDLQVRAAAAFALGQIGSPAAEKGLVGALRTEQDMTVLSRIFEALGKCGDEQALMATVSYIASARNMAVKRDQALSLARFAMRKIKSERAVWLCYDLLNDNHAETRWAASYALWRFAPMGALDLEISRRPEVIQKLMNDKNEEVRINVAALLGRTKSDEAPGLVKLFCEVESKGPDWRVQVQLARAAASLASANPGLFEILLNFLESTNDHVRIATLTALSGLSKEIIDVAPNKERVLSDIEVMSETRSKSAELVQGESMVTFAKLFPVEFSDCTADIMKGLRTNLLWSKYIEALSLLPTQKNLRFVFDHLSDDSVRVQMAAWEFVPRMIRSVSGGRLVGDTAASTVPSALVQQMHASLSRRDMAVTTLVVNALTDSSILAICESAGFRTEIAGALVESYRHLSSRTDVEAMLALQTAFLRLSDTAALPILQQSLSDADRTIAEGASKTLRLLTGREFTPVIQDSSPAPRSERDWKALESVPAGQRIVFKTTKGTFTIRLRKDAAPFTVLVFYGLAKEKFYDGLTFHRVVPDFVIQGGDPRGDGWGGPGFAIRSEWSLINFVRGSVGLASSGKDTEGCQFFITHVPTPHLDGRYTVFATVSSGMEVVDKIQVGDRILSVELR
jgi:cyclophilin family peptidyl-prolyl cis-trans isomerase/HEAT repeat protein